MTFDGSLRHFVAWVVLITLLQSCQGTVHSSQQEPMEDSTEHQYTNALIHETSPYLLQHAHNPVNWRPWSPETLELAAKENKPIIVSIGYAACHWCHVMEKESFEDEEVARVMNENFICIKVDREERPDVDQYYMTAANLITGGGGWPLNCFALPDGQVFHAGTYYRKPDWLRVLHAVAREFEQNKEKLEEFATQVGQGIRQSQILVPDSAGTEVDLAYVHRSVERWKQSFDPVNGGPARAPKFPLPDNMIFLMRYGHAFDNDQVTAHVQTTLDKMAAGGIYDQVGGGFCRYAVDELWKVPHFEKMLYDNAQLITLYAEAYKKFGTERYLDVARESADFCIRELCSPEGIFYSSLDADSEGEEGKYYVWSQQELTEVLGDQMDLARLYFKLDKRGEWEGNYILLRNLPESEIAAELGLSREELETQKQLMVSKLTEVRKKRVRPGLDDKSLTSWNAMMVSGLINLYQVSGDKKYLEQATRTLDFLLEKQVSDDRVYHSYKNGKTTISGFLEDYALLIEALINVNASVPDPGYLRLADKLAGVTIRKFYNPDDRIFHFTSLDARELSVAPIEIMDNVIPSSMAVMVGNLRVLYLVTGRENYQEIYLDLLRRIAGRVESYGSGYSRWMQVMLDEGGDSHEIVIAGADARSKSAGINAAYLPGAIVVSAVKDPDLMIFEDRFRKSKTLIYVCRNRVCRMPVEDVQDALAEL